MKKVMLVWMVVALVFGIAATGMAQEEKTLSMKLEDSVQSEVQAIREEPMNLPLFLQKRVDVFAELLRKFVEGGEPSIVMEDSRYGLLAVDGPLLEADIGKLVWGYVLPGEETENGDIAGGEWYWGGRFYFDKIDLTKDIPILKELKPGFAFYKGRFHVTLSVKIDF